MQPSKCWTDTFKVLHSCTPAPIYRTVSGQAWSDIQWLPSLGYFPLESPCPRYYKTPPWDSFPNTFPFTPRAGVHWTTFPVQSTAGVQSAVPVHLTDGVNFSVSPAGPVNFSVTTTGPVNFSVPTAGSVYIRDPTARPVNFHVPTAGPVNFSVSTAGPVFFSVSTAGRVYSSVSTVGRVYSNVPTAGPVNFSLPTAGRVYSSVPTARPVNFSLPTVGCVNFTVPNAGLFRCFRILWQNFSTWPPLLARQIDKLFKVWKKDFQGSFQHTRIFMQICFTPPHSWCTGTNTTELNATNQTRHHSWVLIGW